VLHAEAPAIQRLPSYSHAQHSHRVARTLCHALTQRAATTLAGTPGKRNRMRERLLWHDPPAYFDFQPGFVTFNLDVPAELLKNAGPRTKMMNVENSVGHFELVNHQITQVGASLRRTLLCCGALELHLAALGTTAPCTCRPAWR
jgi:hypothetical protein